MKIKFNIIIPIVFLFVGCNRGPSEADLEVDLRSMHPKAVLISGQVNEGDSDCIYIYVEFQPVPGALRQKEVWQYIKNDSGDWIINNVEAR